MAHSVAVDDAEASTVDSQQEGPGFDSNSGLSVLNLHVLPVFALVLSGCSGLLPQSTNMQVR